jgi:pimeloyl-ACP methyl ester carboxylesterase
MPTVLRDGCAIHYQVHGGGRPPTVPVLLIPGWGCDAGSWGGLLESLQSERPCITLDNRGSGRSGGGRRPFGIATMADDCEAVLDALGVARVDVLGNSLGGMVGQAMALRHRRRLRCLVLLSSTPGVGGFPSHPTLVTGALRHLGHRLRIRAGLAARGIPQPGMTAPAAAGGGVPTHPPGGPGLARRRSLAQLGASMSWFGLPWLSRIQVPTLVIHGTHDAVVPALNARLLARLIPGARLHLVPGAGHLILDSSAGRVAAAVSAFLADADRADASARGERRGPAQGETVSPEGWGRPATAGERSAVVR